MTPTVPVKPDDTISVAAADSTPTPVPPPATSTASSSSQPHPTSSSPNGNSAKKNNKNKWKPLPIDVTKTARSNSSKPARNARRTQSTREERPRDRERTRDENTENRPVVNRTVRTSRFSSNRSSISSNYRGRSRGGFARPGPGRRGIYRSATSLASGAPGYAFAAGVVPNQGDSQTFVLSGTHYYNAVPTAFIEMDALSVKEAIKKQV